MPDYIEQAIRTEAPVTGELEDRLIAMVRPIHAIFGLITEVGELADVFKRHIFYATPLDLTNVAEEVGDQNWYQAIMLSFAEVEEFAECQRRNIAKLKKRYPEKFTEQDAVERDLDAEREVLEGDDVTTWVAESKEIQRDVTEQFVICAAFDQDVAKDAWRYVVLDLDHPNKQIRELSQLAAREFAKKSYYMDEPVKMMGRKVQEAIENVNQRKHDVQK